ncbi:MAG: response regulator receiver protein [Rhizobium sp.]|nr:response regulator receiver protein [Rhizobium sp.]
MAVNPTHVLVVEDEVLIRLSIVCELEEAGFIVFEASNSTTAIEILIAHPEIQAMFTDINMPGGVSGLVLAAAVRDRWPPIHIIVTSSLFKLTIADLPIRATFLAKPYDADEVVRTFRHLAAA